MKNSFSHKPAITVIMPVYNMQFFVGESIDSILSQTFTDFEFIIIDDGSTDRTYDIIRSYKDQRIILLKNPQNIGNYPSRNNGIQIARGKYIAVMDGDDIAIPIRLETQYKYLEYHSTLLAVGTKYVYHSSDHTEDIPLSYEDIHIGLLKKRCMLHSSLMIRSDILHSLGGYNEIYLYASDYDLMCNLALKGEIENLPNTLMIYRWHESQISKEKYKEQEYYAKKICRNYQRRFINKYKRDNIYPINEAEVGFLDVGRIICYYTLARHTKKMKYESCADDLADIIFDKKIIGLPLCLENGLLGLGCGLIYMLRNGYIDGNEDHLLSNIDNLFQYDIDSTYKNTNIDWFGWLYYLLLRTKNNKTTTNNNTKHLNSLLNCIDYPFNINNTNLYLLKDKIIFNTLKFYHQKRMPMK